MFASMMLLLLTGQRFFGVIGFVAASFALMLWGTGGEEMPFTYGELQAEMDLINRAYIEVMSAGDARGRVFTFPIPTYNITADFPWESENARLLFDMSRYSLPSFL